MLKPAIIYDDGDIYVEFDPDKFKELLNIYFKKTKSIDKSMDAVIKDLKNETAKMK